MALTKSKIGAIISLHGGTILFGIGLVLMKYTQISRIDESTVFEQLNSAITIVLGCIAIIGSIIPLKGKSYGYILLILVGLLGAVGTFIPIYSYEPMWGSRQFTYLCGSAMYIDLVLITVGGILGIALKESNKRA